MFVPEPLSLAENATAVQPPPGAYRWSQTWRDVFFAHWQLPARAPRPHVPACLDIDTWHGHSWISVVAFRLDVHLWQMPNFGLTSDFVELNLRTYVRWRDQPGIQFLSIYAGRRLPVALARLLTPLPYVYAPLSYVQSNRSWRLTCQPRHTEPLLTAEFSTQSKAAPVANGSLDAWLLERYRAYAQDRHGNACCTVAQHRPWSIQRVDAQLDAGNLGPPWGLDLNRQPDETHFASHMTAKLWPFESVHDKKMRSP